MKALHLGALLAVCVVSSATAQTSVGPVAITNIGQWRTGDGQRDLLDYRQFERQ